MFKKLNSWIKIVRLSYLKVSGVAVLFSILLVCCKCQSKGGGTPTDPNPRLNWLDVHPGWDTVAFVSDPSDSAGIELEKRQVRVYIRGWLAEYNAEIKAIKRDTVQYQVAEINFARRSTTPLRYTITAFLAPNAHHHPHDGNDDHHGGPTGHLIPPEPPPPQR